MQSIPQPHGGSILRPDKGESGNPYGRPKKLVSKVLSDLREAGYERVGASSISEAIEVFLGLSESVLRSIHKDKEQPMFMRIAAEAILERKGRFQAAESLLDRAHGKAKQQVDLSGTGAVPIPTAVTVVVQAVTPPDAK